MKHLLSKSAGAQKGQASEGVGGLTTIFAESGRMKDTEESKQGNVFRAQDKVAEIEKCMGAAQKKIQWMNEMSSRGKRTRAR